MSGQVDQELVEGFRGKGTLGDMPLTEVTKDNMFDLHKVEGPRLCMPPSGPSRNVDDHVDLQWGQNGSTKTGPYIRGP